MKTRNHNTIFNRYPRCFIIAFLAVSGHLVHAENIHVPDFSVNNGGYQSSSDEISLANDSGVKPLTGDSLKITASGAGGTVNVPLLAVEKLVLATDEGIELIWRDLTLPVYDIDPSIAGIFGCELLTSGWFEAVIVTREFGYIEQVHLDFRDPESMTGAILLDLNPDYDNVTGQSSTPGDANGDGIVDDLDLTALATHWQQAGGWADGDFNDDGFVDDIDLTVLAMAWPAGDLNVSAVPEPTTLSLLVVLALSLPKRLGLASTCVTRTRRDPTGAKSR